MTGLSALDWGVVSVYAAVVVGLGLLAERRQSGSGQFFLGGRDLPWPLVGVSILATAFSAASLLGGPGEAYGNGLLWLQLQAGDLLAIVIVAWLFIPFFRGLELTTAYEYLERRFGVVARTLASALFHLQVVFRAGVLVYGPALALSTMTGVDLTLAVVLVGIVATIYTYFGGITAVIWTDALQLGVIVVGVGLCAGVAINAMPGGFSQAMEIAREAGRTRVVDTEVPWTSVRSWLGALVAYGVLSLSVAGTNQQPVQRYLSCRSVDDARRAAVLGWGVGAFVTVITLGLGLVFFAFYEQQRALPEGIAADAILPHFVVHELPSGAAGLLVAAIFAAAMSSLDSALNSLATASTTDFYRRFRRTDATDQQTLAMARRLTLAWGVVAIGAGLYVASQGQGLLGLMVRYVGYFAGPILGLFLLGFLSPRTNANGATVGVVAAFSVVLLTVFGPDWFGWPSPGAIWMATLGTVICTVVGRLASLGWDPPRQDQLRGLVRSAKHRTQ